MKAARRADGRFGFGELQKMIAETDRTAHARIDEVAHLDLAAVLAGRRFVGVFAVVERLSRIDF